MHNNKMRNHNIKTMAVLPTCVNQVGSHLVTFIFVIDLFHNLGYIFVAFVGGYMNK